MNRREFIGTIGSGLTFSRFPPLRENLRAIGVQMFSIRDAFSRDADAALKSVADIGFREVEAWSLQVKALGPANLKMLLDRHHLTSPSRSCFGSELPDESSRLLAECEVFGNRWLVYTALPTDQRGKLDSYKRASEWFNSVGAKGRDRGIQFGFHPEPFDYPTLEGVVPLEYLVNNTDPALVKFQLDLGHAVRQGKDPVSYLTTYPDRFFSLHLRDVDKANELATLGQGTIDFKAVLRAARSTPIQHYFIEEGRTGPVYEYQAASFQYMSTLDF